ncbi:cyclic GMP-AMP synthase-like receptor [Haematobia irritans]|uniref:cyclic GMP-AMP synthase-like receptor n=1 Tax=Haematobia irritans TaxID=7368 RepID=UPI003F4FA804
MFAGLQPNLEGILININKFINIDKDREQYATHFEALKIHIFGNLRKFEPFGSLFRGYQMGGSYGDNLKVSTPNEFDLVFHIQFPENKLINVLEDCDLPGNVHLDFTKVLHKIHKETQNAIIYKYLKGRWLDERNYLIVNKLQAYFQSCFSKVLAADMNSSFRLSKLKYTRQGPAHTIEVLGHGFQYSVDFVPGILLDEKQSVVRANVGQWEAIPKPIHSAANRNYTSFRSSFYRQEQKLINFNYNLKNALRIMKKFRDAHPNMHNMKSYYIKTIFLWKISRENQSYWKNSLMHIILEMFGDMQKTLIDENLPFYWDQRLNMYDRLSSIQLREMLQCVASAKRELDAAANCLSIHAQKRVFKLFLNRNEREACMECNNKVNQRTLETKEEKDLEMKEKVNSLNVKVKQSVIISSDTIFCVNKMTV